jgi:TDG/mug DNA glycosylase family protein
VGNRAALLGAYYAGRGNQFWPVLFRIGLTPRVLAPNEFQSLPSYLIGLTDLVTGRCGADSSLSKSDFNVSEFRRKMAQFAPRVIAFNGKRAAQEFYECPVRYGHQAAPVGRTVVFVLPSTSAAARRYWDESYWIELALFLGKIQDGFYPVALSPS